MVIVDRGRRIIKDIKTLDQREMVISANTEIVKESVRSIIWVLYKFGVIFFR